MLLSYYYLKSILNEVIKKQGQLDKLQKLSSDDKIINGNIAINGNKSNSDKSLDDRCK